MTLKNLTHRRPRGCGTRRPRPPHQRRTARIERTSSGQPSSIRADTRSPVTLSRAPAGAVTTGSLFDPAERSTEWRKSHGSCGQILRPQNPQWIRPERTRRSNCAGRRRCALP